MTERILHPGSVSPATPAVGVLAATIVGTQPVWSDDSDATYSEFTNYIDGVYYASLALATLPPVTISETAAITVRIRGRGLVPEGSSIGVTTGLGDPDAFNQWLFTFTDIVSPRPGVASPSSVYNITDWVTALRSESAPLTPETRAAFAAGVEFAVFWESVAPATFPAVTTTARIYELEFVIVDNSSSPLRRFPPVNNGGFGPTRHWPRTVNRRAGGTY